MKFRLPPFSLIVTYLIFLALVSIIPLVAVGFISFQVSWNVIQDESRRYTAQLVDSQQVYLEAEIDQAEALITNILSMETITTAISQEKAPKDTYTDLATQAQIGYILSGYTNIKGLVSIDLYCFNGKHYHVGDTLPLDGYSPIVPQWIFDQLFGAGPKITWLGLEDNINIGSAYKKVVSVGKIYSRVDRQSFQEKPWAVVIVNYDIDHFYSHFNQNDLGKNSYLVVADQQNRMIFHPDQARIGEKLADSDAAQIQGANGTFISTKGDQPVVVNYSRSERNRWTVLSFIPLENFTSKTTPILTTVLVSILLCIVVILFFAAQLSKQVIDPIRQMTNRFKMFQSGAKNWNTRLIPTTQDEIGELIHWFNTFSDNITALQKSEQDLRESEERYALAMRGANDGLWDWDLRHEKIFLSTRWKAMLGYTEAEIGDSPEEWLGRVHPDEREMLQEYLANHLSKQTAHFEIEHRLLHKDGSYRWVLARGLAVFDPDGQAYRISGSHSEITARKEAEEKLRQGAYYDSLTGLPNRVVFIQTLTRMIRAYQADPARRFSVLFMDVDGFKRINDSLGHLVGDQLLIKVAGRLEGCLRSGDLVARLGGDEFALLLDGRSSTHDPTIVADRILKQMSVPMEMGGQHVVITASIGVLMSDIYHLSAEDYLRDSDAAMYWAKQNGKNSYAIFDKLKHYKA